MAWTRYNLKFTNQAEFLSLMPAAWQVDGGGEDWAVCVIGTIYHKDVRTNGLLLTTLLNLLGAAVSLTINLGNGTSEVQSTVSGYHVNLSLDGLALPAGLAAKVVTPAQAKYTWG